MIVELFAPVDTTAVLIASIPLALQTAQCNTDALVHVPLVSLDDSASFHPIAELTPDPPAEKPTQPLGIVAAVELLRFATIKIRSPL